MPPLATPVMAFFSSFNAPPRSTSCLIKALAALVIALSAHSRTGLPVARELEAAGASVQKLTVDLGAALRTYSRALPPGLSPESAPAAGTGGAAENPATDDFLACRHFFAASP